MLLAIDVGNTETVLGLFRGTELTAHWRLASERRRTADELAVLISSLVTSHRPSPDKGCDPAGMGGRDEVTGIVLCSTVPPLQHELRDMVRRYYGNVPSVVVGPGTKTGIPVVFDDPREVGADRIVNSLAAATLFGGPCIVVDLGTATTFDVVSGRGEYIGGAIAPGIAISLEALEERGAQLRKVELARPRSAIAKNTVEGLQSGAVYGFAGLVDGLVERIAAELDLRVQDLTVIATGGLAPLVVDECRTVGHHEPWLTLIGLRLVYERNNPHSE